MNKRFLYLSLSFFLISLGLMLLSFSSYKPAKAATTTYNSTWTMSKCRTYWPNTGNNPTGIIVGGSDKEIFLGPDQWQTNLTVGSTTVAETWTVTQWHNYLDNKTLMDSTAPGQSAQGGGDLNIRDAADSGCNRMGWNSGGGDYTAWYSVGAYGFIFTWSPGNLHFHTRGGGSVPTAWGISGTITQ